jgi:hypothetical protein
MPTRCRHYWVRDDAHTEVCLHCKAYRPARP